MKVIKIKQDANYAIMILIVHGAIQNKNAYLLIFLVKELSVVAFKNGFLIKFRFYKYRVCEEKKLIYGEIGNVDPEASALINPD